MTEEKNLRPEEETTSTEDVFWETEPDWGFEEAGEEAAETAAAEPEEALPEGESPELSAQAYDRLPKAPETEEDPYEGKEGVDIEYDLTGDEVMRGLLFLQKKQLYRRNIIYSALLAVIFVIYVIYVIRDPGYTLGIFLMLLSATVIGFIWYLPYRHRKSTAKAMELHEGGFTMTVFETGIRIVTENGPQNFLFDDKFKAWDLGDAFLVDVDRYRIYILPKRCLDERAQEKLAAWLPLLEEPVKAGSNEETTEESSPLE